MNKINDALLAYTAAFFALFEIAVDWLEDCGVPTLVIAIVPGLILGGAMHYMPMWATVLITLALGVPMLCILAISLTVLIPDH